MNIKIKVSNSNNYTVGEQAQWEKKITWKVSNYCIYTQKCMLKLHNAKCAPHKFSAQQIQSIVMKKLLKSTHLAVLNQQNWVKLDVIAWSMNALRQMSPQNKLRLQHNWAAQFEHIIKFIATNTHTHSARLQHVQMHDYVIISIYCVFESFKCCVCAWCNREKSMHKSDWF